MSTTLRKSSGDLFIHPETGRPEEVDGPTKVDQELADLYLSEYDQERDWGSEFQAENLADASTSINNARMVLYLMLQQANDRILRKQEQDATLDPEETITEFSETDVLVDAENQAVIFVSVAEVGDDTVEALIGHNYKQADLDHVVPPPAGITPRD